MPAFDHMNGGLARAEKDSLQVDGNHFVEILQR
jgi:hypothetical protein